MLDIITLDSISDLNGTEPIYIYGSARQGQAVLDALGDTHRPLFKAFIDSTQSGECRGYPVLNLDQFRRTHRPGDQIVIASVHVHEIGATLTTLGVRKAFESNTWLHLNEAREKTARIQGGTPLKDRKPVDGAAVNYLRAAQRYCDRLQFDDAAVTLLEATAVTPSSPLVLSMLAYVRFAQNMCDEALDLTRTVLELEPRNFKALERLGCIQLYLRQYDEVMIVSRRQLDANPDSLEAIVNYRDALMRAGMPQEVDDHLRRIYPTVSSRCQAAITYLLSLSAYLAEAGDISSAVAWPPQRVESRGRFVLTLTVFGEEYLADALMVGFPSLLASGNIGAWAEQTDSLLLVFTDAKGRERIRLAPAFIELSARVRCHVVTFPQELTSYPAALKYQLLNFNHMISLRVAKDHEAGVVFLAPDLIYSTNFFGLLAEKLGEGKQVLLYSFLPVPKRSVHQSGEIARAREGNTLSLDAADLTALAERIGFSVKGERYRNGGVMTMWPYRICWPLPNGGVVFRVYVPHPLVVSRDGLASYRGEFFFSNDSEFVNYLPPGVDAFDQYCLVGDHDRGVAYELVNPSLTPQLEAIDPPLGTHDRIAAFGLAFAPLHRWLLSQPMTRSSLPPEAISDVIKEADCVARDIHERISRYQSAYGARRYVAGYSPFLLAGFPEFPVEV